VLSLFNIQTCEYASRTLVQVLRYDALWRTLGHKSHNEEPSSVIQFILLPQRKLTADPRIVCHIDRNPGRTLTANSGGRNRYRSYLSWQIHQCGRSLANAQSVMAGCYRKEPFLRW
jgi:hypothetical protein